MSVAKPTQSERLDRIESMLLALAENKPAIEKATTKPKANAAPKVPFMSCWLVATIKPNADGLFSHTDKRGKTRQYGAISEADAIANVKANYRAGKTFAIAL